MAKIPVTEAPIRIFREVGGAGQHAAVAESGTFRLTFIADTAMGAKAKAKTWIKEQTEKAQIKRKPAPAGAEE